MSLPFMPMYWGDYWRDTNHLSDAEHVSYLKLISHYWTHGSLPDDDARLARIAGRSYDEWMGMKPMLQAFFKHGWKHSRVDKELQRQQMVSEANSHKARKAAATRWGKMHEGMLGASVEHCSTNANQNHNQIIESISPSTPPARERKKSSEKMDQGLFEEFWMAYPRRVGREAARRSFEKALKLTSPADLMTATRRYAASRAGQDENYTAHPATWLNQGRWADEPAGYQSAMEPRREMSREEQIEASRRFWAQYEGSKNDQ